VARRALAPLAIAPTQRVAELMAELEEKEHGDEGRAREWMTRALHGRRDPAWTADGYVSERWLPVSPVTGRLDAFEWKDPLSGHDGEGTVIEVDNDKRIVIERPRDTGAAVAPTPPAEPAPGNKRAEPADAAPAVGEARPRRVRGSAPVPVAPAVIPLVHAPDDPGPEAEIVEPQPEPEPPADRWGRLGKFFKP
jgi:HemY protein